VRERPLALSTLLIVATIAAGRTIRLAPLGLPNALVEYRGSLLWALMIYWIGSSVRSLWPLTRGAFVSSAIALCVELFKLYHAPMLDAFRLTLPGKLLLGVFSLWHLVAYAAAIIAGVLANCAILSTRLDLNRSASSAATQLRTSPSLNSSE
jgi:hypothetical protein